MVVLQRLRLYHAVLAALVVLAYLTGEAGIVHAWLGYGVAAVIIFRLIWATSGVPQLGLMRFYPHFQGLKLDNAMTHPAISRTLMLSIAVTVIATAATGIAMDRGRALGINVAVAVSAVQANDGKATEPRSRERRDDDRHGLLGELHETLGNLILPIVALHVLYLRLFKRPLARFMLFVPSPASPAAATPPAVRQTLPGRSRPF